VMSSQIQMIHRKNHIIERMRSPRLKSASIDVS
jgi:hypothetical protein